MKHESHWKSVADDLLSYTLGGGPPPALAFDRLMALSREEGVPRWAILAAIAEADGKAQRELQESGRYAFDLAAVAQTAHSKHQQFGVVRENAPGHEL